MYFFIQNGKLCCEFKNSAVTDIAVRLEYRGDKYNMLEIKSGEWQLFANERKAKSVVEEGEFQIRMTKSQGAITLQASFTASAAFTKRKCYRLYVEGFLPVRAKTLVYNAPRVIGRVGDLEMGSCSYTTSTVENQTEEGSQYMAFKGSYNGRGGYYGTIGFVTFEECFGGIILSENGNFSAYASLEENFVYPKQTIKTDKCWIFVQRNNKDVLSVYGKRIAKENKVQKRVDLPTGWCSWYYYGPKISQEKILENMQQAKAHKLPIKYIQIDDGWQKCYGDWEANEEFSMGMKALAERIKEAGFTPGIWVAPFLFAAESETFKNHPEFFIKNEKGEFLPNRLIDFSVKGARKWLYDLAHKLSVEWGYRYIKIDLVSYRLAFNGYSKKGFNALKNFREAIKIMRSAVTEDTVFMTCTSPLGASAGIAECARVSDDIFERWKSLKGVATQVFRRYYVSQYINTDPDCLMVRTKAQHDDETFRICVRDEREIKTFVNFMSAAGGAIMLSDKFTLLNEGDIEKVRTLFPINKTPAKPLDIFEREVPSVLYYGKQGGLDMYALFNWTNAEDTLCLEFAEEMFVRGYYSGETYAKTKKFSLKLLPHDSEIIYVAKEAKAFDSLKKSIMPVGE